MSRVVKEMIESELKGRYGGIREAVVVNPIGLTGNDANSLRRHLRSKNYEIHVVSNRMFRRATAGTPLASLADSMDGPCALVTGGGSAIELAKELLRIAADFPKLELKLGLVEGLDSAMPVEDVAKLRGRLEIIADIAACAISPGRKLAGAIRSPGARIAGCLKTIIEKVEKGEPIAKAG